MHESDSYADKARGAARQIVDIMNDQFESAPNDELILADLLTNVQTVANAVDYLYMQHNMVYPQRFDITKGLETGNMQNIEQTGQRVMMHVNHAIEFTDNAPPISQDGPQPTMGTYLMLIMISFLAGIIFSPWVWLFTFLVIITIVNELNNKPNNKSSFIGEKYDNK